MGKYLATYGKPRFLGIVEFDGESGALSSDGMVIAASHRGDEAASVTGPINEEQERGYRNMKTLSGHGDGPAWGGDPVVSDLKFVRFPSGEDRERWRLQKDAEGGILREAQGMVEAHKLELKLIDAETMIDGKKLFFYFTSETRVDFRTLVKDLARRFRTRIELRQMGVRDEARIISGMASCGLPCCCSYWLNQFAPIGIKMVKEQNIALNPSKTSGICGRLMCCMSFEHQVYKNLWAGLPGPGSKIKTPGGNCVVSAMDVAKEAVRCYKPGGGVVSVPVALFQEFRAAVTNGDDWEPPETEREAVSERTQRGKYGCSCGRDTGFGARGTESAAAEASAGSEQEFSNETPKNTGEQGKCHGHRRGRRGGRRHKPDAAAERGAPESQPPQQAVPKERANRPKRHDAPHTPPAETPRDAGQGLRSAEPHAAHARRRRKKPKRGPEQAAG